MLARKLAERTRHAETLAGTVQDLTNEVEVAKRKGQQRLKEVSKELSAARRRLEQLDLGHQHHLEQGSSINSLSPGSRYMSLKIQQSLTFRNIVQHQWGGENRV